MPKPLYILLLLAALVFVGCADEAADTLPAAPLPEAAGRDRTMVPLTFEATLAPESPAGRAVFTYSDAVTDGKDGKGIKTTWQTGDALGVYIKTAEGTILRAGSITTTAGGGTSQRFTGNVLQKFDDEGETYIYMHPDINDKTYVNLEEMDGQLGSTAHIAKHLPIVWDPASSGTTGKYLGYIIRLTLDFNTTNPGKLKKVSLLTSRRNDEDRIFPRHYSINNLANLSDIPFNAKASQTTSDIPTGLNTSNSDFTHTITFNVTEGTDATGATVTQTNNIYTAEVYLTSSQVENLNLFSSHIYVQAINEGNKIFASNPVSFKGQNAATNSLLSSTVLPNGTVRKLTAVMTEGTTSPISPTIINSEYKISSILGMWNEYGKPYDPCGLIFLKDGSGGNNSNMPTVLVTDGVGQAIHDRYTLTNSSTGTPTFTWQLYESQCATASDHKQADVTCNNIDITAPTEIYVSFLSEYAWNQNLLGYYHYPTTGNVPASAMDVMKNIIFPNLSKPGHEPFNSNGKPQNNIGKYDDAPLREYMTVKLIYTDTNGVSSTTFPAGTTIGFWGMIDVKANGFQQTQYSLLNWNQWRFFSNSKWNASNSGWTGNYNRCNFFASGDICKTSTTDGTTVEGIVPGVAIYGFKDNVTNDQNTAFSTCIFLVSASNPSAMKTYNKACFNIGCATSPYPTNIVLNK